MHEAVYDGSFCYLLGQYMTFFCKKDLSMEVKNISFSLIVMKLAGESSSFTSHSMEVSCSLLHKVRV